jgi:hypothetical protein
MLHPAIALRPLPSDDPARHDRGRSRRDAPQGLRELLRELAVTPYRRDQL